MVTKSRFWGLPLLRLVHASSAARSASLLPVILLAAALAFLASAPVADAVEGKLTISDREIIERLARLEEGQKSLQKQIAAQGESLQKQIDGLQAQINDLRQTMMGGFGILFAGMMGLIGFVLWDRRTALAPAVREADRMREILREFAKKEPKLAEIMRSAGLL